MRTKNLWLIVYAALMLMFVDMTDSLALDDTDSIQCDGGIVERGDSEDAVKEKCGNPVKVLRPDPQEPAIWVYNFGPTQFVYHISMVNGAVERIQTGSYGD